MATNGQVSTALTPYQKKVGDVRSLLERSKGQIKVALPKHMDGDRMLRITMTSVQKNPRLLDCDPMSLVAAVIQSATLGLEPDGALGEAYLVPYGGKVQFQAGYKGMMKLARQSGAVGAIGANVVRKRDVFEYTEGPEGTLRHVPFALDIPDEADDLALKEGAEDLAKIAGPLTHAYAWAKLKDGTIQRVVLNRIQVLARREKSSGWQAYRAKKISDNPWATSPAAMWQKTAIRELMKLCPQSVELARALKLDAAAESGAPQDFGDVIESTATEGDAPAPPRTTGDLLEGGAA